MRCILVARFCAFTAIHWCLLIFLHYLVRLGGFGALFHVFWYPLGTFFPLVCTKESDVWMCLVVCEGVALTAWTPAEAPSQLRLGDGGALRRLGRGRATRGASVQQRVQPGVQGWLGGLTSAEVHHVAEELEELTHPHAFCTIYRVGDQPEQ